MPRSSARGCAAVLILVATIAACRASREPAPAAVAGSPRRHTPADADFIRRMIGHHEQALLMTELVPERTTREDLHLLAERIAVSQESEIANMRRWLVERGEPVPPEGAHAAHHGGDARGAAMPGMLTPAEMDRLRAASGGPFDRLFLELMIRHHEGALAMVSELFASSGAAQEAETFRIASDVDADQRSEIQRMRALLSTLPGG